MRNLLNGKKLHNPAAAQWALRLGLAFVFIYAGMQTISNPAAWVGYLPHFLAVSTQAETFLKLFAFVELGLAGWLLGGGKYVRYAALMAFILLAGIAVGNPSTLIITFRDVGLAAMAVALFFSA